MAPYLEPEALEHLYPAETVSDGYAQGGPQLDPNTGMGCSNRSEGCIPTHPYQTRPLEVPSIPIPGHPVRIHSTPIRPFHLSSRVHTSSEGGWGCTEDTGSNDIHVSRRLAHCGQISRSHHGRTELHMAHNPGPRLHNQHREVSPLAYSVPSLPRSITQSPEGTGLSHRGTHTKSSPVRVPVPAIIGGSSKGLAQAAGPYGQSGGYSRLLQTKDASHPAAPTVPLPAKAPPHRSPGADYSLATSTPPMVVGPYQPDSETRLSQTSSIRGHHDRCVTFWLGSHPPPAPSGRSVGTRTSDESCQFTGDVGGSQGPPLFPTRGCKQVGAGSMRQLYSRSVHQPPRGNKICQTVCTHMETPPLVHASQSNPVSSAPPRQGECDSRRPLQGMVCPNRMDTPPTGCSFPLSHDRLAPRRSVCVPNKSPTTGILFEDPRSLCLADRCISNKVGRPTSICLPPVLPHPSSTDKDRGGELQDSPNSTILAPTTMVLKNNPTLGSSASNSSEKSGHPASTPLGSSPPGARGSSPDVLGAVTQSLRAAGLSQRAAYIAACSRRASTRKVYKSRLRHFYKWCRNRSLHPPNTSVGEIADFLVYLFEWDLSASTIRNYRSAIAAIHLGFPDRTSVSDNKALGQLVRGMFVSRPPTRRLIPSWDLFNVLSSLSRSPFEPMGSSTLLDLSIKVTFLLAVATSRRRSELHSLTIEEGHIRWEPGGVRLIPKLGFLTKNQSESFLPPDIFVADIKSFSSVADDKFWCPVRALKWYISRTKTLRAGHSQLFIATTPPHQPASRDTISRWLISAIRRATDTKTMDTGADGPVRAHDVRAASTSWAFFKGISIGDITQAACWKTPNTFTECYLKDVLQAEGRAWRAVLEAASRSSLQSRGAPQTGH